MKRGLEWIKSNFVTVVFAVVMIAAVVALPLLAARLNQSVQNDLKRRADTLRELEKLEKTSVTIDDTTRSTLVNQKLLDRFVEVTNAKKEDARRVQDAAIEHNRKGRGVLMDELFPDPPPAQRDVIPRLFHRRVIEAHEELLERINAGTPPTLESLKDALERRRRQFLTFTLQKDVTDPLDEHEQARLTEELAEARLSRYSEAAERIGIYAGLEDLNLPEWDQSRMYSMEELFEWQWRYWIHEDLLVALAEANDGNAVLKAPVKRLLEITVWPHDVGAGSGAGAPSGPGLGFGLSGDSGGGARSQSPAAVPADPRAEVRLDFSVSLTGRTTNPLYDVRLIQLRIVADTARIPEVLDALARQNFITILDLDVEASEPYQAVQSGYLYGAAPTSVLTLQLETVWLRSWTQHFMPESLRIALGIPVQTPVPPAPAG